MSKKPLARLTETITAPLAYWSGLRLYRQQQWKEAATLFEQATQQRPSHAPSHFKLGMCHYREKAWHKAAACITKATQLNPTHTEWAAQKKKADKERLKADPAKSKLPAAKQEELIRALLATDYNNAKLHNDLAHVLRKQGKWWQEIDALKAATGLEHQFPTWHFRLGEALEVMNRFQEAAQAYAKAIALKKGKAEAQWHYREGYCWERSGDDSAPDLESSTNAYRIAIQKDIKLRSKRFGIGVFHQARGLWPYASKAYIETYKLKPWDAELCYRLGMAFDRCYRWNEAENFYRQALCIDSARMTWHYRLGFVLERQGKYIEAAKSYEYAAHNCENFTPYWFYRCGYTLFKSGHYVEATEAFIRMQKLQITTRDFKSQVPDDNLDYAAQFKQQQIAVKALQLQLKIDTQDEEIWFQLGQAHERSEDWQNAANAYREAIDRANLYKPTYFFRLAYCLAKVGKYDAACIAFIDTHLINRRAMGIEAAEYEKNPTLKAQLEYTELFESLEVRSKIIVYESYLGASIGCNPYAIYRTIINDPKFSEFKHVWVITPTTPLPNDFKIEKNTIFIQRQSYLYRRFLATAEYLINNVTFPSWFIRRNGQKYLNTWHGTPLKGLGKDTLDEFHVHGNVTRNFLHATHLISPNRHTSDVMMKSYEIAGLFKGRLAETGYPRIDHVINSSDNLKQKLYDKLGLSKEKSVVLYAPTWRGIQGGINTDMTKLKSDIEQISNGNYQVIFRGHHFIEDLLKDCELPVTIAGQEFDTCDLLSIVDVLVTDYSSILFDFIPTGRPVVYYTYDLDEYRSKRNLYFSHQKLPGVVCLDIQETKKAIASALTDPSSHCKSEAYLESANAFSPNEDGFATRRVLDFLFENDTKHEVDRYDDDRNIILFYNGQFIPNGITSSFLNLIKNLSQKDLNFAVAIDPSSIRNHADRIEKLHSLPEGVKILAKEGRILQTAEELWLDTKFLSWRYLPSGNMQAIHAKAYEREFIRLYSINNNISTVVNFEGYNGLWSLILANATGKVNITWLHNDMMEEHRVRMPYLTRNFTYLNYYNTLVSVSGLMSTINSHSLGNRYLIPPEKFTYCENVIDVNHITKNASKELDADLLPWFQNKAYLTVGRLSPEKDHEKLIRAFARTECLKSGAKLIILGEGPMRGHLENLIETLGLNSDVLLAGQRDNPFPAIKSCDCFVLSSNHEGQPMVLLEALTLNKKVIATDINGNRAVLQKFGGLLVENSIEGLANAMDNLEIISPPDFNPEEYRSNALSSFTKTLLTPPSMARESIDAKLH